MQNNRYAGKIKVVGSDLMCFPVCPKTLEPAGTAYYDAYAWVDPELEPIETISMSEYLTRREIKRG